MRSACILLIRYDNGYPQILTVSRKNNPNDIGIPGGKEDDCDNCDLRMTAARELMEETGYWVDPHKLYEVFQADGDTGDEDTITSCLCITFMIDDNGFENGIPMIRENDVSRPAYIQLEQPTEKGVVAWRPLMDIVQPGCSFATYNKALLTKTDFIN